MKNLFDQTEKFVKSLAGDCAELRITQVLNPFDQTLIDEARAKELGIIFNGYYRNNYGGLIPLRIAASKGFVHLATNDDIHIEYHSTQMPIITRLAIHQVYDGSEQRMISCRQAIDRGCLNLQSFSYSNANVSMAIHEAFCRGLIIGELRTTVTESKPITDVHGKHDSDYDNFFSSLTNMINSLSEFRNTVHIGEQCELTSDGHIREKKTGRKYLLTEAVELGFVSMKDTSLRNQLDHSQNQSTLVNETMSSTLTGTRDEDERAPYFSETFIGDLLKATDSNFAEEWKKDARHLTATKPFLSSINTC